MNNYVLGEKIKCDILSHIERLANPPWIKQAKQVLFHYKQKNPEIFQDACLYSDACKMFANYTYRLGPRRLIHELFFDVNFSRFLTEAKMILAKGPHMSTVKMETPKSKTVEKLSSIHIANEQRKAELSNTSHNTRNIVCIIRDPHFDDNVENLTDKFSPSKCELRSPPLSSVQEELASTENLLANEAKNKTEVVSTMKSLDSLKLSYKENKFPIRERGDSRSSTK